MTWGVGTMWLFPPPLLSHSPLLLPSSHGMRGTVVRSQGSSLRWMPSGNRWGGRDGLGVAYTPTWGLDNVIQTEHVSIIYRVL